MLPVTLFIVLPAVVLQYWFDGEDRHHPAGCAVLRHRCRLVLIPAGLQHEHRGLGRPHSPLGVDAETAVFMLLYLDLAYRDAIIRGQMNSWDDLREAIVQARSNACGRR